MPAIVKTLRLFKSPSDLIPLSPRATTASEVERYGMENDISFARASVLAKFAISKSTRFSFTAEPRSALVMPTSSTFPPGKIAEAIFLANSTSKP